MPELRWLRIGDICSIEKGITGLAAATPGEYPLVATGAERRSAQTYQFDTKAVCIPLVSSSGHGKKTLNYVHFQEGKFALGTILAAVIPKDKKVLDARYLHTYLKMNKDRVLVPLMRGAANVSLSVSAISEINIPVPSLPEQKKALSKLDCMSGEHAELLLETDKQLELLKQLRRQILQDAIEGKLTTDWRKKNPALITGENHASKLLEKIKSEKSRLIQQGKLKKEKTLPPITEAEKPFPLPEGWTWCRLGDVCSKIGSGSTPKGSNYATTGIPFFRSQNVHDYGIVNDDIKFISSDVHVQMDGTRVLPGDLLLNITGGSIGRCSIVPLEVKEGNVSQHVCIIRVIYLLNGFLHELILSPLFQKKIFQSTTGSGREGLPKYNLEQFVIPLPPLEEQSIISLQIEKLTSSLELLEKQVSERKNQSEMLMQSVLREAFER